MLHPLETKLIAAWPPSDWGDVTVAAAVSGGCDSVALLRALAAVKPPGQRRLFAVHLNHRLRPEADDDQRFVVELCGRLGIKCEVGHADVAREAAERNEGIEAAARHCRYRFLQETAERLGARFVVTAHTADDQAETILHRIVRGTGIRGLSGMARTRTLGHASLVRPLLGIRRAELIEYLDGLGQPYHHDASNADRRYTRNRIRLELLPRLREHFNPEIDAALLRLGTLAGEAQTVLDLLVEELFANCAKSDGPNAVAINLDRLIGRPRYIVREVLMTAWRRRKWPLQAMGMTQWDELAEMATAPARSARRDFPGGVAAEVSTGRMRLTRNVINWPA